MILTSLHINWKAFLFSKMIILTKPTKSSRPLSTLLVLLKPNCLGMPTNENFTNSTSKQLTQLLIGLTPFITSLPLWISLVGKIKVIWLVQQTTQKTIAKLLRFLVMRIRKQTILKIWWGQLDVALFSEQILSNLVSRGSFRQLCSKEDRRPSGQK